MSKEATTKYRKLIKKLEDNFMEQKEIMMQLEKIISSDNIGLNKRLFKKKDEIIFSTFNAPILVPKPLAKILKIDNDKKMTRCEVSDSMYKYFKENKMYDKNKKIFIPSKKIRKIFGMEEEDTLTFYNFHMWLRKVYEKEEES